MPAKPKTAVELLWSGKYDENGKPRAVPRINLPFQIIETINESAATRAAREEGNRDTLFSIYQGHEGDTVDTGWHNKLIWGDNQLVMGALLEKFAGKINLIYIDPPFATGLDFTFNAMVGEDDQKIPKAHTALEEKAYRDTWGGGMDSYIAMMHDRLTLMRELLAENGSIYVHCDGRVNAYLRLAMDEIFGKDNFRNEIAWCYRGMPSKVTKFSQKYDHILYYVKSPSAIFNVQRGTPTEGSLKTFERAKKIGYNVNLKKKMATVFDWDKYHKAVENGTLPDNLSPKEFSGGNPPLNDWWKDIGILAPTSNERSGYPTQKPEALLKRIITASSNEGDLVADFFCGSGTTLAAAEKLGRRWIGSDLGRWGIHTTRKRLLGIEHCKPLQILNLGKYERQHWQDLTFGKNPVARQTINEYIAFILKLYRAHPIPASRLLHGEKGDALVFVGAVDAPVTIQEITEAVAECRQLDQHTLHILGWEYEMGGDLTRQQAQKQDVNLTQLRIPREVMDPQAIQRDDIHFYQLAYLDAAVQTPQRRQARVELQNFVIPDPDLIPDEARANIKKWSDYIDYWAIDWNYQNDTFMQGWVAYRTNRDRTLATQSHDHSYDAPGTYQIMVKIIDIFGNDTSHIYPITIK